MYWYFEYKSYTINFNRIILQKCRDTKKATDQYISFLNAINFDMDISLTFVLLTEQK